MSSVANRETSAATVEPIAFSLRPGVSLPDWSLVHAAPAREALGAILEAFGIERCFAGYSEIEDRVRQAVLVLYGELGRAPDRVALAEKTGLAADAVRAALTRLRARDLIVLDEATGEIMGAYPFTERASGHHVRIGARTLNAMCAVDALGAGAMYGADSEIRSACRECGAAIVVRTVRDGAELLAVVPAGAVVWNGIHYEGQAADSLCRVIAFFCSDAHLEGWSAARRGLKGFRLSLDEALQVGKALFVPVLAPPVGA